VSDLLRGLPPLLASHLELSLVAIGIALALALPLAVVASARPRFAIVALAIAGVVQTVPGLALLALVVPVVAELGGPSFGFVPAAIALTLYAMLPILRNAVTGLRGVDAAVIEAARGMGMTRAQIVRNVQLPLAVPVIAAGVRTATVWTVGTATLATPVGQQCLGNYIFAGLQTRNFQMLLVGVAAAAALAIVLDALLAALERALGGRMRRRAWLPAGALVAFATIAIAIVPRLVNERARTIVGNGAAEPIARDAVTRVRLGGKTFTEQYILVELMRARLERAGVAVDVAQSLGSVVVLDALARDNVDAYVEYTGTLWTNAMKREKNPPRWQILVEVEAWLAREHGVRSLGSLGFENTYALAVRRDVARRLDLHTLADLARHASELSIGADYEFFSRAEWEAVQGAYGLAFAHRTTFDPTLLYDAVARGEVDVISAFSSDGRIAANDLVVLADPLNALPPYDAMILLAPGVAGDARIACVLGSLHVSVEQMRQANAMVDRDHETPVAAAAWLDARLASDRCGR
jgi:osmoprotectant transport system permease protein